MQSLMQKTIILLLCALSISIQANPSSDLSSKLDQIVTNQQLRGLQLQITQNGTPIFSHNSGTKNSYNQSITSNTMFMVASLSKSVSGVAIMQLVQKGFLKLNDTLSSILGFDVKNPYYPDTPITVQMTLCHQTSIAQSFTEYMSFMAATQNNTDGGASIPLLKQILLPGGKYYNPNIYSQNRKPGQYFSYSNLGYIIAGTIVEIVSKTRFDIYVKQNILDYISEGQPQNATFNPATIQNYKNLGWIFVGQNGSWIPNKDNYTSYIAQKNLTLYKLGTNAGIYNPSAQMRASIRHLNNYLYMIANKGVTKNGKRLLSESSINELIKPRYQYHGPSYGNKNVFHTYGLGIYTTTYLNDIVIDHEVVRGHLGNSDGLISAYFYWKNYCFSYVINGALNGYGNKTTTIYQLQRVLVQSAVNDYISQIQRSENLTQRDKQADI